MEIAIDSDSPIILESLIIDVLSVIPKRISTLFKFAILASTMFLNIAAVKVAEQIN